MKRLLVTGSRNWREQDSDRIADALRGAFDDLCDSDHGPVLVHGDCRGADRIAAHLWNGWGLPVEAHPADWSLGPKAGPTRNAEMVALGADLCVAFQLDGSAGTENCIRLAHKAGIPVRVIKAESS